METKKWTKGEEKNGQKEILREHELNGSDGWEVISTTDYQSSTPEEIVQRKNRLETDIQKALENL